MLKSLARTWIRTSVLRKGLSGDSKFWAAVGVLGLLRSLLQRYGGRETTTVLSSQIRPGEVVELRYGAKPDRSLRKQRRRADQLVQRYATAAPGRQQRTMRRKFAGTVLPELAAQRVGSSEPGSKFSPEQPSTRSRGKGLRSDSQRADDQRADRRRSARSSRTAS